MKSFVVAILGLGLAGSCADAASHYSGFEEKVVTLRLASAATGERLADVDVQYVQLNAQPSMLDAFSGPPGDSAEIQRKLKTDSEGRVTITLSYFVSSHWERDEPDSPHEDFYYPIGWIRVRVDDAWEWCRFPRKYKDEKVRIEVVSGEAPRPPEKSPLQNAVTTNGVGSLMTDLPRQRANLSLDGPLRGRKLAARPGQRQL